VQANARRPWTRATVQNGIHPILEGSTKVDAYWWDDIGLHCETGGALPLTIRADKLVVTRCEDIRDEALSTLGRRSGRTWIFATPLRWKLPQGFTTMEVSSSGEPVTRVSFLAGQKSAAAIAQKIEQEAPWIPELVPVVNCVRDASERIEATLIGGYEVPSVHGLVDGDSWRLANISVSDGPLQSVRVSFDAVEDLLLRVVHGASDRRQLSRGQWKEAAKPDWVELMEQAEAGDVFAMNALGASFNTGMGVPLDYEKAAYWWRRGLRESSSTTPKMLVETIQNNLKRLVQEHPEFREGG
jgi:hypothetical protein